MMNPDMYRDPQHAECNVLWREGYKDAARGTLDENGKFCTPYTDALNQAFRTIVARHCTKLEGQAALLDGNLSEAQEGYERIRGLLDKGAQAALPEGEVPAECGYQEAFLASQSRAKRESEAEQMAARACAAKKQAREVEAETASALVEVRNHAMNWLAPYRAGVYAANPEFAKRLAPFGEGDLFNDDASRRLGEASGAYSALFDGKPPVLPFGSDGGPSKQLDTASKSTLLLDATMAKEAQYV